MHISKNYLDLIYDSYMRCMIIYQGMKISLNLIDDLYIRYMISYQDLNFSLNLNFIYIYVIYAYMMNLKSSFKIKTYFSYKKFRSEI